MIAGQFQDGVFAIGVMWVTRPLRRAAYQNQIGGANMSIKFIIGIVAMSSLTGCASVEGFRPDIAAKPVPSRLDEIAYINVLRSAFVLKTQDSVAANGLPDRSLCFDGTDLAVFKSKSGQGFNDTKFKEEEMASGNCLAYRPNPAAAEMRHYLTAGFGITDLYCQRFFTVANASEQNRKFGRNVASGVDVMVGSILSLSGAGETAVGIANAGFGLLDTTFESYDTAYLVAPDMSNVQKLVLAAQDEYRKDALKSSSMVAGYPAARSVIERYATLCTFSGMRELVNKSLKDKTDQINLNTNAPVSQVPPAIQVAPVVPGAAQPALRTPTTLVPAG